MNHDGFFGDDREKFVTMKEDNFEFDLILLQLRNKIALSSRCPPQASFLSLCSHIGHNASGLRCSDYNLWRILRRQRFHLRYGGKNNKKGSVKYSIHCFPTYFPAPLLVSSGKPTQVHTSGYSRQTKNLQKNPRG